MQQNQSKVSNWLSRKPVESQNNEYRRTNFPAIIAARETILRYINFIDDSFIQLSVIPFLFLNELVI